MRNALFSMTPSKKLSCNMGELVPISVLECLPGDTFDQSTAALIRTQPLLAPVMHEVDAKIHHWFVPLRTLWTNFPDFITGGPDGMDDSVAPYITVGTGGLAIGSLGDYLGLATGPRAVAGQPSALPYRAYAKIWNEYYRDQDLQTELVISYADGADTTTNTALQNGCWEKDYFTSARPNPQKGPSISIPLTGNAPVYGIGFTGATGNAGYSGASVRDSTGNVIYPSEVKGSDAATVQALRIAANGTGTGAPPNIYADMSDVSAINIEDLRYAASLQRYEENLSRFGSRYVERVMAAFGVRPRSLELDLPQYLGGGQQKVQISEVLATAEGTTTDVGDMKGHGISGMRSNRYRYTCQEHGLIMSFIILRPRTNYVQGDPKLWNRETKEDYYQPELAFLGQQPIYNKELYAAHASPNGVFGYQDSYESYRQVESTIAGEFRDTLDFWHMARKFASPPALNADFVKSNPTDRIYAVPAADQLYIMVKHRISKKSRVIKNARPQLF